jgi:hypothetical protein
MTITGPGITPYPSADIEFSTLQMPFYQGIGWKFGIDERNPWIFSEAVNMPVLWFEGIPVASLSLNANMITLYLGQVYELLSATVRPSNARWKEVTWESSDSLIASVSAEGVVKTLSLGTTFVRARSVDGGHEAICRVNVIQLPLSAEKTEVKVNVYPNPVREELYIESSEDIESVAVYNAAGALLLERRKVGAAATSINVSHLPKGISVLVVRSRSGMRSLKFVVL